ncbi:Trp biosynthesis-associated membrane protein [Microbacterium murale]|uniref:Membrane protein (TIGR02234 family) n=1 Tax=Microbacterium murale TaxID=1081040 RepID=A0ABU0PDS5_9MICO|nr:Trp biosynthesis-associated membrane protein [Microbacterium murale]MDQ0645467.1 putative membrane protein (TIGR02234 family) [Microbacterium murale]
MKFLRRGRSTAVVAFLLAGAVGIISSTQTWLSVVRADAGEPILVPGADALALLAPLSLAMLALGAALALVGRTLRYVFATLALLAGVVLTWWTAEIVFTAPVSAVAATVTETTGLAGGTAVTDVIASVTPTFWPVLALIGWVLLIVAAVFTILTANHWKSSGRRYRTDVAEHDEAEGPVDAIDSWDDLSRGTDPTR